MSTPRHSDWLAVVALLGVLAPASPSAADEDDLAAYRERFRQGMDKYKAGAMAEAIRTWSAIYEELGPQRGYRLSFNLARAYEANSETTRAAERYESFLDELAARRRAGESLDPIVDREGELATARLAELNASNGRIHVAPGALTVLTQVDSADPRLGSFVAYVAPGPHTVTFAPGTPAEERREISIHAGELLEVDPTPPPPAMLTPPPTRPPTPVAVTRRIEVERPFSPIVLYIGVGATAVSVVAPVVTYAHAYSLIDTHNAQTTSNSERRQIENHDYPAARTAAYATLAIPITLGAATVGLAAYYFGRSKEKEIIVTAAPTVSGAAFFATGRF